MPISSDMPAGGATGPADAFVGKACLGAFMEAVGARATPSPSEVGMGACVQVSLITVHRTAFLKMSVLSIQHVL
jgi:hypothetical protein